MPKANGPEPTRIDKRVAQFVALRDLKDELKEKHKKELAPIDDTMQKLVGEMLQFLKETGQKSARTAEGLVTIIVKHSASCSDPDLFINFVRENDQYELLDRRANVTACRAYAEENGSLPPGVKLSSITTVGVTKS